MWNSSLLLVIALKRSSAVAGPEGARADRVLGSRDLDWGPTDWTYRTLTNGRVPWDKSGE